MSDMTKMGILLAGFTAWMTIGYAVAWSLPDHIQCRMSTCGSASNGRLIIAIGWPFFLFTKNR